MNLAWFANYSKWKSKAPYKRLLEKRGFLVYCTLKYSLTTAYMKGIHLWVESYFSNEDNEDWERELLQQEPDTIDIIAHEEKILNSLFRKPIPQHLKR